MTTPSRYTLAPSPDDRVGPYLLRTLIGRGGMAEVWLAIDPRRCGVHRLVAIKRLLPHLANDPEYVEMFLDEATIGSRICHTNVCRAVDHGTDAQDHPYLVMEHLCGEPLNGIAKRFATRPKALPVGRVSTLGGVERCGVVARVIADACAGLHAFHEIRTADGKTLDAVHRDVSPDNVFVTCDGTTKLMDFGVAKANVRRHRTETGLLKGKLAYLAPETLANVELDRRADIWALGVITWELLCNKRLFRRDTDGSTLKALTTGEIPHPSDVAKDVPRPVGDAVMGALERKRSARYDEATELGAALLDAVPPLHSDAAAVRRFLRETFEHDESCHVRHLDQHDVQAVTVSIRAAVPTIAENEEEGLTSSRPEGERQTSPPVSRATTPAPSVPPPLVQRRRTALLAGGVAASLGAALALLPATVQSVRHARASSVAGMGWRAIASTLPAPTPVTGPTGSLRVEVWDAEHGRQLLEALLPADAVEQLRRAKRDEPVGGALASATSAKSSPTESTAPSRARRYSTAPTSDVGDATSSPQAPEAPEAPEVGSVRW